MSPTVFFIELISALFVLILGVALGWLLQKGGRVESGGRPKGPTADEHRNARAVLDTLHDLAATVAADVGEHSSRIQAINAELTATGDSSSLVVVDAVSKLVDANQRMQGQLQTAEQRMQEQAIEIEMQTTAARTDALTSLANRRALDDELQKQCAEAEQTGDPACLMMVDIDHFKKFNDTHGHSAGDEVLKGVAKVLLSTMGRNDFVARYGGEEFSVLLPGTTMEEACLRVEMARAAIENARFTYENHEFNVTLSLGVASLVSEESPESWIGRADDALYDAKQAGRNRGHWHDGTTSHPIEGASTVPTDQESEEPATEPNGMEEESGTSAVAASTEMDDSTEVAASAAVDDSTEMAASTEVESDSDTTTGLPNQMAFGRSVQQRLAEFKREGASFSIVLLEIDLFSDLIEQSGERTGETLLQATTQFLNATMREMDLIARYDVNIFALMLPSADLTEAGDISERLRQATERCNLMAEGDDLSFTISLGVAESDSDDSVDSLLERADEALASAAQNGRNCTWLHTGRGCEPVVAPSTA